ncbi:hypothetical protein [Nitrospira sp. Nam74]
MADERGEELKRKQAEEKERERVRAEQTEQRALESAQDGDIVLVRESIDANKHKVAAGTKLVESEDWPAHRIQFMLDEGHAKMKGAEVKTGDGKEGLLAGAAKRLGGKGK